MHQAVIVVAKYFILLSVLLAVWTFAEQPRGKKKEMIVVGLVGAVLSVALAKLGSHLYYDPRPFVTGHFTPYFSHGNDNGFPSDHTLLASFLAFLSLRYSKKFGAVLLILALAIGLSRVQAGVHHLIDIIGSFVCTGIGVSVAFLVAKRGRGHKSTYTAPTRK